MKINFNKLKIFWGKNSWGLVLIISVLAGKIFGVPLTLPILLGATFFWQEKIFPWAFGVGLFLDFFLNGHLGVWSLVFLLISLGIVLTKRLLLPASDRLDLPRTIKIDRI